MTSQKEDKKTPAVRNGDGVRVSIKKEKPSNNDAEKDQTRNG